MSERDEFEDIGIAELVTEESPYDAETDRYDFTLRLSEEPPELWAQIFDSELGMGKTGPVPVPMNAEIRGDRILIPDVTKRDFEETLLPWLKSACSRTNNEYIQERRKAAENAKREAENRAKLEAKREKAKKDVADLAERLKKEANKGE